MLLLQPASVKTPPARRRGDRCRIGLAIAGGGPIGAMYELGALRALDDAIEGLDLNALDVYVGVSSGSFLAAALANGMGTAQMFRIFITGSDVELEFRPEQFLRPAVMEYARRATGLPLSLARLWRDWARRPGSASFSDLLDHMASLVPTGVFDNAGIESFLRQAFTTQGRSNDFRELERKLFVVAVDINSGEAIRFGAPGWDDVPISKAIQASSALPGLYPPVEVRGRQLVDGALRRTMHASVALDEGIDLLLGINPLVPFDASRSTSARHPQRLTSGGLPVVLSQTFRTLLQSRMEVGLAKYTQTYPGVDQLVFEPNPEDGEMFFTSIFGYRSRARVCDYAYRSTLGDLRQHAAALAPLLAHRGLGLRRAVIDDPERSIFDGLPNPVGGTRTTLQLRDALDRVRRRMGAAG